MARVVKLMEALAGRRYSLEQGITQTILSKLECRRKFLLCVNGWGKPDKSNFTFGRIGHDCLECIYGGNQNYFPIIDKAEEAEELDKVQLDCMRLLFEYYLDYYKSDFKLDWVSTEQEFDLQWEGFRLRGKIDGVIRVNGKLWLFEHKFYSQIPEDKLILSLSFNGQIMFYVHAAELLFGEPIQGVVYNIVRRPRHKSVENFQKAIEVDQPYFFPRYEIRIDRKEMNFFRKSLLAKLYEIQLLLNGDIFPYLNEEACVGKFACDFLPACSCTHMTGYIQEDDLFPELSGGK